MKLTVQSLSLSFSLVTMGIYDVGVYLDTCSYLEELFFQEIPRIFLPDNNRPHSALAPVV